MLVHHCSFPPFPSRVFCLYANRAAFRSYYFVFVYCCCFLLSSSCLVFFLVSEKLKRWHIKFARRVLGIGVEEGRCFREQETDRAQIIFSYCIFKLCIYAHRVVRRLAIIKGFELHRIHQIDGYHHMCNLIVGMHILNENDGPFWLAFAMRRAPFDWSMQTVQKSINHSKITTRTNGISTCGHINSETVSPAQRWS